MSLTPDAARRLAAELLGDEEEKPMAGAARPGPGEPAGVGTVRSAGEAAPRERTIGRYRVLRLLGAGGMGEVHLAQQDHPRRDVALKLVRPELVSAEARRRFEHEARILGRLQHPGIAQIFDAGEAETETGLVPYFAMELVEGKPLTDYAAD